MISQYDINQTSIMKIKNIIIWGIIGWSNNKFSEITL